MRASILLGFLLTVLGCAQAQRPVPATPEALDASNTAVVISRGFARSTGLFGSEDTIHGQLSFVRKEEPLDTVDLLSEQGGWATDTGAHRIQVVSPGTYYMHFAKHGTSTLLHRIETLFLPGFNVEPGDVIYLGDIDLLSRIDPANRRSRLAVAEVKNKTSEARAALQAAYPQLAGRMQTRLVRCLICR